MHLFSYTLSLALLAFLPASAGSFSDGHGDGVLTGWTAEGPRPWLESGGYARAQDGFSGRGFLLWDMANSPDGSFSATLACDDLLGSTLCRYGGLLFRYTDSTHLYAIYLQEADTSGANLNNKLYLLKNTTNTGVALGASKMELASGLNLSGYGRHYSLRVSMDGPRLTFYLGAQQVAYIEDYENLGGRMGYFYDMTWNRYASLDSASWIESSSPPTDLFLSADSLEENAPAGTLIGLLSAADSDAGEIFTYAFASGSGDTDNASFTLTGNELRSASLFDYESKNSYSVRIQVTDASGRSFAKAFPIAVLNVNDEVPVLVGQQLSMPRTSPLDTLIATLTASDADQMGSLIYALVAGNTDSTFALDSGTGSLKLAKKPRIPDYSLGVQVSDGLWTGTALVKIHVSGFPRWDSAGVELAVMDSASQTMRSLVWYPGDTIVLDSGNRVRLELRLLDTAGGWQGFALSPQANWTVETALVTLRGWWKVKESGLQNLTLGWGLDHALDSLVIPVLVNRPEPPRLNLLEMGAIYSRWQKAVLYSGTDAPVLPGVPDKLIFRFSAASRGIPQWTVEPAKAGFITHVQDSIWLLQWNYPSQVDQGLAITLLSGNGGSTTLQLGWTYSTTAMHTLDEAGFQLHPELHAFSLPRAGPVRISTLDARGRIFRESLQEMPAGLHELPWSTPRGALTRIEWEGHRLLWR